MMKSTIKEKNSRKNGKSKSRNMINKNKDIRMRYKNAFKKKQKAIENWKTKELFNSFALLDKISIKDKRSYFKKKGHYKIKTFVKFLQ